MEVSLKVQNIGAPYNPDAKTVVITHEFTPPSDQALKKRGRLFITLKIGANEGFDLSDISSLFLESIEENFYHLSEETPLHALEKALTRATKLVLTIKSKDERLSLASAEANFNLSFATALIWNRVIYTSYYGSPAIYLVRGTGVRNLSLAPAHNELWTNSGMVDDQDVIILGTDAFAKAYPASEIIGLLGGLSQSVSTHKDRDELAAILIKVSTTERNKSPVEKEKGTKLKDVFYTTTLKLKERFSDNNKLSDRFKFYQSKKTAPVSSITGLTATAGTPQVSSLQKGNKRLYSHRNTTQKQKKTIAGLVMIAGIGIIGLNFATKNQDHIEMDIESNISIRPTESQVMGTSTGETNKPPELHGSYMDIGGLSGNINPIAINSTINKLLVLDSNSKKLFSITPETKESKNIFEDSKNIPEYLKCDDKYCYIADNSMFYLLDPEETKVDEYTHNLENLTDIYPFSGYLYLLTPDKIYNYELGRGTEAKEWLASGESISNARAIAIDGNIYVITDTEVAKYYNRKKTPFNLDFSKLINPIEIEVYKNNLYILDVSGDKKAIEVFNKATGAHIKSIALTNDSISPKSFTVARYSKNEDVLLFEKDRVLYEVKL